MHNLNIQHDIINHLFYTKVKGGMAQLTYDKFGDKCLDFKETHVPEASRGMGVATHLIESALDYAKDRDIAIKPSCPMVKKVLEKSADYKNIQVL